MVFHSDSNEGLADSFKNVFYTSSFEYSTVDSFVSVSSFDDATFYIVTFKDISIDVVHNEYQANDDAVNDFLISSFRNDIWLSNSATHYSSSTLLYFDDR